MEQLIKITTIPIQYELKINEAKYERKSGTAEVEISREEGGGLKMKSRPIQLKIDSFDAWNSMNPTPKTSISQAAQAGQQAAMAASAQYMREGRQFLKTQIGEGSQAIDQMLAQRTAPSTGSFTLGFTPSAKPEIDWTPPALSIEYEMDKLNFDLKKEQGQVEFIPGSVEMVITQMPDVKIEYVGDPVYVPPSAMEKFRRKY